jgi:hypothetical protein
MLSPMVMCSALMLLQVKLVSILPFPSYTSFALVLTLIVVWKAQPEPQQKVPSDLVTLLLSRDGSVLLSASNGALVAYHAQSGKMVRFLLLLFFVLFFVLFFRREKKENYHFCL